MFRNQTVLITGAAGGLGSALARKFAGLGAALMLLDKDSKGLDLIHDAICEAGLDAPGICPMDLSLAGPDEFGQLAELLLERFDGLHHLVHCAAAFDGLTPLDQTTPADWLRCLQVNLNAAWLLTVQCLPLLRRGDGTSVTFVLDEESRSRSAYWGAYGVSKSALRELAYMFTEEMEGSGVRILAVNPGPLRTQLRARAFFAEDPQSLAEPDQAAAEIIQQIYASTG